MTKSNRKPIKSAPTGQPARKMRMLPIAAALVATGTLALFLATLVAANTLATQGISSGNVSIKISNLKNENANLEAQVASLTAVSRIYTEAMSRGYVQPDKVMYTTPPSSPVALKSSN